MERKINKRHFTQEGHISTEERSGKDRSDTYYKRSRGLLQAAEALHKITRAHVKVETIPTWPHGVRREYSSPGYPLPNIEVVDGDLSLPSFVDLAAAANNIPTTMASTPVREDESDNVANRPASDSGNVCHTCGIQFDTEADKKLKSPWMGCARKGCPFWVHATCANIFYKDTEQGFRALGKWAEEHFFCRKHRPES